MLAAWAAIQKTEELPPFGEAFYRHLQGYKGARRNASSAVWNLLWLMLGNREIPADRRILTGERSEIFFGREIPPDRVLFAESGKPYFEKLPYHFSLSHSKNLCAAALSDRPVGVDIESCRPSFKPRLVERSLAAAEKEAFDGDFTRIWCRKEAVAKMTGKGIIGFPSDIDTTKYRFEERMIEYNGERYWLAATEA